MAEKVRLRLVTPGRLLLDRDVDEVTVPGALGELGILPNHISFLTSLEIGEMSYKEGTGGARLALSGGYAEVLDNVMTVLANAAEFSNEIDVGRAQSAQQKAEKKMEDLNRDDKEFIAAESSLHRALIRIQVAASEARK